MVIDYLALENRLYNILINYLPERKYVDLDDPSLINRLGFSKVNVNCCSDESLWFFRFKRNYSEINYYFGIDDENDVKLILEFITNESRSFIDFFVSGKVAVKIKFTTNGAKAFNSMKKIFKIRNHPTKKVVYNLIMLISDDESEIVSTLTNIIRFIDFDYGEESLLINGFKENAQNIDLSIPTTDKSNFTKDSVENTDLKNDNLQDINFNDLFSFESSFKEDSVDGIISKIEITKFKHEITEDNLLDELNEFKNLDFFKSLTIDFADFEINHLMDKIEMDITSEKIFGDIFDIVNFYFDEYKSIKRHYLLNNFLDEIINEESFMSSIRSKHNPQIIDKIRHDIANDNIMDEEELIFKLKSYYERELVKNNFYKELEDNKKRIPVMCIKFNLTPEEIYDVFNSIEKDIEKDNIPNDSLRKYIDKKLDEKVELNRSNSRLKLNNVLKKDSIKEKISNEEMLDYLNDKIGRLIYSNEIKSDQITEEYLINEINNYGD